MGSVLSAGGNAQKRMIASTFRGPLVFADPVDQIVVTLESRWVVKSLYVTDTDILSAARLASASRSAVESSAKSTPIVAAPGGWKPLGGISRRIRI